MASGGFRPGAGRPKGAKAPKAKPIKVAADIKKAARQSGLSPLDYMLIVMNRDDVEDDRRDRMAIAAAPYMHARASDLAGGKKEQQQEAADRVSADGKFATPPPPPIVKGD